VTPAARVAAAIGLLDDILAGGAAERLLTGWGRASRYAGSGDRAAVRDLVFDALRRRRSFAALGGAETGRGLMIGRARAQGQDPAALFDGARHGPAPLSPDETGAGRPPADGPESLDCPDWLWPILCTSLGETAARATFIAMQQRAPVHLRVNRARATRDAVAAALGDAGIDTVPHPLSPTALEVAGDGRRLRNDPRVLDGTVEFQDAASQAVSDMVPLPPGGRLLDYCAGGGGKTLAIGARVPGVYVAHDAHPRRMADLPARAARAGLEVALRDTAALASAPPFDTVVVDAPCSGSGSWRRDPAGKWALTPARLAELCALQDDILGQAARHVRPGGHLVHITCSVIADENDGAVARFLDTHSHWRLVHKRQLLPAEGGDGFFAAILASPTD
jgi:16S rRNA (cytosine967-C5)-methyltransferase